MKPAAADAAASVRGSPTLRLDGRHRTEGSPPDRPEFFHSPRFLYRIRCQCTAQSGRVPRLTVIRHQANGAKSSTIALGCSVKTACKSDAEPELMAPIAASMVARIAGSVSADRVGAAVMGACKVVGGR